MVSTTTSLRPADDAPVPTDASAPSPASTTDRVAQVLLSLGGGAGWVGVSHVARATGLGKAVVHRILQTLQTSGLVAYDPERRLYRLGPAAVALGRVAERDDELRRAALPLLAHLADVTGETTTLSARTGHGRVYIGQVESRQRIRITITLGESVPLWVGASGLAILAFLGERDVDLVLDAPLRPFTERTEIDAAAIRTRLTAIRAQGYARSAGERVHLSASISAPVFDHADRPAGALSVAFLESRLEEEAVERYALQVLAAAREASTELRRIQTT